jgi:hypothetical protein
MFVLAKLSPVARLKNHAQGHGISNNSNSNWKKSNGNKDCSNFNKNSSLSSRFKLFRFVLQYQVVRLLWLANVEVMTKKGHEGVVTVALAKLENEIFRNIVIFRLRQRWNQKTKRKMKKHKQT